MSSINWKKFFSLVPPQDYQPDVIRDPCYPSPCGPNSQCLNVNGGPACSCLPTYIGGPPSCRPECTIHSECRSNQACIREKCQDPCPGLCGISAQCTVINHIPSCTCLDGYQGDAFTFCQLIPPRKWLFYWTTHLHFSRKHFYTDDELLEIDPCNPSPCGSNAVCNNGVCTCMLEYQGDPYVGCRPECVLNSDCPRDKACLRSKCVNPCSLEACARNAICEVVSHIPMCRCPPGFEGSALVQCQPMRSMHIVVPSIPFEPCTFKPMTFSSRRRSKSLSSITLRPEQSMQGNQWSCIVLLCTELYRKSSNLSSGMYRKLWLSIQRGMFQSKMS